MKKEYWKLNYLIKDFLKLKVNLYEDDVLHEFILFFKKTLENIFIPYDKKDCLSKEEILSTEDLFCYLNYKINWFFVRGSEFIDVTYNENGLFNLVLNLDFDRKLFFIFKLSREKEDAFDLSKNDLKLIEKKKNNLILINISTYENSENKILIKFFNVKNIFDMKLIRNIK